MMARTCPKHNYQLICRLSFFTNPLELNMPFETVIQLYQSLGCLGTLN